MCYAHKWKTLLRNLHIYIHCNRTLGRRFPLTTLICKHDLLLNLFIHMCAFSWKTNNSLYIVFLSYPHVTSMYMWKKRYIHVCSQRTQTQNKGILHPYTTRAHTHALFYFYISAVQQPHHILCSSPCVWSIITFSLAYMSCGKSLFLSSWPTHNTSKGRAVCKIRPYVCVCDTYFDKCKRAYTHCFCVAWTIKSCK